MDFDETPHRDTTEPSIFLPRNKSNADLGIVLSKQRRNRSEHSRSKSSLASSRRSQGNTSENSQVLYMADCKQKKTRKGSPSLPNCHKGSLYHTDIASHPYQLYDTAIDEETSWKVIDREIFEWQSVCQTGRAYWWASGFKRWSPRLGERTHPHTWMREVGSKRRSDYASQRRAASDNYFAHPPAVDAINDLAHLVAIQLLSSCFTISLEHGIERQCKRNPSDLLPDIPMISSLRMHMHFRYSPSFGHQAQNPSPVQPWPSTFDGPPRSISPSVLGSGEHTPENHTRHISTKERRTKEVFSGRERTWSLSDLDNDSSRRFGGYFELNSTVGTTSWPSSHGTRSQNETTIRSKISCFQHRTTSRSEDNCSMFRISTSYGSESNNEDERKLDSRLGRPSRKRKVTSSPQAVIGSESHPVFIQPVRELVVKRWRRFRRRLSGSLHGPGLTMISDEHDSLVNVHGKSSGSVSLSSNGKIRRRRAQESGDIENSSSESTPHCNSPASGCMTPLESEESMSVLRAPPTILSWNPDMIRPTTFRTSNSSTSSTHTTCDSISYKSEDASQAKHSLHLHTPSATFGRRYSNRRKSHLSEVFTQGHLEGTEIGERGILSVGSALATPPEELMVDYWARRSMIAETHNHPKLDGILVSSDYRQPQRPAMTRKSSTGSQVFTSSEDGIELDGLPVGPARDVWATEGNRQERTYL